MTCMYVPLIIAYCVSNPPEMANGNSEEKNNKTVISHILLQLINHKTYQGSTL
jgi:hypothetical protein